MSDAAPKPAVDRSFSPARQPWAPRVAPIWENLAFGHAAILVVGLAWWFGGQSAGARQALLAWGTIGMVLFFLAWGSLKSTGVIERRPINHLWPLLVWDVLVIISIFNPSTRQIIRDGDPMLVHTDPRWLWLPSTARPDLTLRELWQFNGIVFSCYNVFLLLQRRKSLRRLLMIVAICTFILAVLGTFQKLSGATGIWFGKVAVPQPYFFATFVYHNHWGAFVLLSLGACLGLLNHHLRHVSGRDRWHSPGLFGAVLVLFLAATIPLSGSRSSTLLAGVLVLGSSAAFLASLVRRQREHHEAVWPKVLAVALAITVGVGGIAYLARDTISARARLTTAQLKEIREEDTMNSRLQLYTDTWRMASAKPIFGWGLESYGDVFQIYNSQMPREPWFPKRVYREAHSDWLQSLAENGFVGTALLLALGAATLVSVPWRRLRSAVPRNLLAVCALVLVYAWLEFPFANPAVMTLFWLNLFIAARYARLDLEAHRGENAPVHG